MMKRIFWAALVGATLVVAGMVARQVSATLWRKVMHEEPPAENV
jgi:hypothetical protein